MFWMFYINTNLSIFVIQLFAVKVWAREEYPPLSTVRIQVLYSSTQGTLAPLRIAGLE